MMMHFELPDGKRLVLTQRDSNGPVEARVLGPDYFGNHQYPTLSVSTINASDMVSLVLPQEPLKYYEFQTSNYDRTIYYNNFYTSREIETPEIQSYIASYRNGDKMGHYEHLREIPYKEYKRETDLRKAWEEKLNPA